jgi:hypothetical protein
MRFRPNRVGDGAFERLFWTDVRARDNYRSRLFAMFSEEIVRAWGQNADAPYRDTGRPTLWRGSKYFTLDFALQRKADERRFVAEQKAELAWANYSQLRLASADQVAAHIGKPAFDWFLDLARSPTSSVVKVGARETNVDGAILVWGATTPQGKTSAVDRFGFVDVLSLEEMLSDLRRWRDATWERRIEQIREWTNGLLDGLIEAVDA